MTRFTVMAIFLFASATSACGSKASGENDGDCPSIAKEPIPQGSFRSAIGERRLSAPNGDLAAEDGGMDPLIVPIREAKKVVSFNETATELRIEYSLDDGSHVVEKYRIVE